MVLRRLRERDRVDRAQDDVREEHPAEEHHLSRQEYPHAEQVCAVLLLQGLKVMIDADLVNLFHDRSYTASASITSRIAS